jgi:hypothetical protein
MFIFSLSVCPCRLKEVDQVIQRFVFSQGSANFLINNIIKTKYSSEMLSKLPDYLDELISNAVEVEPGLEQDAEILEKNYTLFMESVKERLTRVKQKISVSLHSILLKLGMRSLAGDDVGVLFGYTSQVFLGFNPAGIQSLSKYLPVHLRGDSNNLWLVISLFIFVRAASTFRLKNNSLLIAASRCLEVMLMDHDGVSKVELGRFLSPEFVSYVWVCLEYFTSGQKLKSGPHAKEVRASFASKL